MRYGFPVGYKSKLSLKETIQAVNDIKEILEEKFKSNYGLLTIPAPVFVKPKTGINDIILLNNRPVNFDIGDINKVAEFFTSPIKWRRYALYKYRLNTGDGILCETNAIRRDSKISNTHSVLWDELGIDFVIDEKQKNEHQLMILCQEIYETLMELEKEISTRYGVSKSKFKKDIPIYTVQQLEDEYPSLSPKERETRIARKHGCFFLTEIGKRLDSGNYHGHRPFDVDDWELTAELVVNFDATNTSMSLMTASVKVDRQSLLDQAALSIFGDEFDAMYHKLILESKLSPSIGASIYKSRLAMFLLDKKHIAEVQYSVWDDDFELFVRDNKIDIM